MSRIASQDSPARLWLRPWQAARPGRPSRAFLTGLLLIILATLWWLGWLAYHWLSRPGWLSSLSPLLQELILLVELAGLATLLLLWGGLGWRWWVRTRRPARPVATLDVADLYALSPKAFESYVAGLFRQKGYRVALRGRSGDHGVDLELTDKRGRRAIVQCKRYQSTVGEEITRELYGTLIHERAAHAFLVTTAEISDAARAWAEGKPLTLIDGATLVAIARVLNQRLRPGRETAHE